MITNKDIRVENGFLIINGDKYPLDGQSPEAIMQIVEDNSDTTPTENSDAPITSGGVYTALGTKQDTLTFDNEPTENSDNPVKSGGLYSLLSALTGAVDVITKPITWPSSGTNIERVTSLVTQAFTGTTFTKNFNIIMLSDGGVIKSMILYEAGSVGNYGMGIYLSYYQDYLFKIVNANGTLTIKQLAEVS